MPPTTEMPYIVASGNIDELKDDIHALVELETSVWYEGDAAIPNGVRQCAGRFVRDMRISVDVSNFIDMDFLLPTAWRRDKAECQYTVMLDPGYRSEEKPKDLCYLVEGL